jgi:hypothetical protein
LFATATAGAVTVAAATGITLTPGTNLPVVVTSGMVRLVERTAGIAIAAGQMLLFCKDNAPNDPYCRDDTNTDRKIVTAPVPLADLAVADGNGDGVGYTKRVAITASGATGTMIDVTIWNSNAPYAVRLKSAFLRVATAAGTAAALRTAGAGLGSVILPDAATPTQTFSTATTGRKIDNAGVSATIAAAGSLFFNVDRAVAGELFLDFVRT